MATLIRTVEVNDRISHERFCLPRPDAEAVRIEPFKSDRYNRDGTTTRVSVTRCIECGAENVDE